MGSGRDTPARRRAGKRVKPLRFAEVEGRFDQTVAQLAQAAAADN